MDGKRVVNPDGLDIGLLLERRQTKRGAVALIARAENLGGSVIVVPARELDEKPNEVTAPYDELSVREAPPYSSNVDLEAYITYWKRLADINYTSSASAFLPTGSGPVNSGNEEVADDLIEQQVARRLRESGLRHRGLRVTVRGGTVLLEGCQNDTQSRLAAAQTAASVPGVREIVNMITVRAEI